MICAATFLAAIGDIRRFRTSRQLVAYLGLDPKVRQSGEQPATQRADLQARLGRLRAGRWSRRRGASSVSPARCTPSMSASGPAAATGKRSSPRRASSRSCSGACSPASEDYAHQQPSLTAKKLRLLEITAGAPTLKGKPTGVWATRQRMRQAERELAQQAEASYKRTGPDWQSARHQQKAGASVTPERA